MKRRLIFVALLGIWFGAIIALAELTWGCSIQPNVTVEKVDVTVCLEENHGIVTLVACDAGASAGGDQ